MSQFNPFFGQFGGQYVPEALVPALKELEEAFCQAQNDPAFNAELHELLTQYAGRPTPLTLCRNLTRGTRTKIYLKREDWAKNALLPRPAQGSTVSRRLWPAH